MKKLNPLFPALLGALLFCGSKFSGKPGSLPAGKVTFSASLTKPEPVTMAELAMKKQEGVSAIEVSDYVFGNYGGDFASPPHADLNLRGPSLLFGKNSRSASSSVMKGVIVRGSNCRPAREPSPAPLTLPAKFRNMITPCRLRKPPAAGRARTSRFWPGC